MARPHLPNPATMSVADLRAEVIGGRDAFEELAIDLKIARAEVRRLRSELDSVNRDRGFLHAVLEARDASAATHAAIIRWLRSPRVALRVGKTNADWLATRCAARDWVEGEGIT